MMIERWIQHHHEVIEQFAVQLGLPEEIIPVICEIWDRTRLKAARVPKSLIVDCVYLVAHMTGNRRSIVDMKDAALSIIQRRTKPFNQDRRRDKTLWIDTEWAKNIILDVIPDEKSFTDFMNR
jgi:transcription initiation factor TFIIIB Brf1 subunit/transcription initiation factor TFIIB